MKHLSLVLGAALGAASIFIPQIAEACSCGGGPWIGASRPADGATDVPTNVIPWVERVGTPRLFDSSGNAIAVDEIRSGSSSFCSGEAELQPEAPLEPNTTYTLEIHESESFGGASGADIPKMTFTTGDGPVTEAPPAPPAIDVAQIKWTGFSDSCSNATYSSCIQGTYEGLLEVTQTIKNAAPQTAVQLFDQRSQVTGGATLESGCLEFKAVSQTGLRSEPIEFCFEPASMHPIDTDEFEWNLCEGLDINDLPDASESDTSDADGGASEGSGCSVTPSAPWSGGGGALLSVLLGPAALMRRREQRVSVAASRLE